MTRNVMTKQDAKNYVYERTAFSLEKMAEVFEYQADAKAMTDAFRRKVEAQMLDLARKLRSKIKEAKDDPPSQPEESHVSVRMDQGAGGGA